MKKIIMRLFLCALIFALIITTIPFSAMALSMREQEDIYRVDTWWKDEYNQSYIDWLLESNNFIYHLDVAKGNILFKTSVETLNINPLQRKENYIEILSSFIGISYEEIRDDSKEEVLDEIAIEFLDGFEKYMQTSKLSVEQFQYLEQAIHETSDYYLGSYYGINTDMSIYGYNAIYERIQNAFDNNVQDMEWSDGKDIVMEEFFKFVDSKEWLDTLSEKMELFSNIASVANVLKEGLALVGEIESYNRADEKLVRFIKYIHSKTTDSALKAACYEFYTKFENSYQENLLNGLLDIAVDKTFEWSYDTAKDVLVDKLGIYGIFAKIGIEAGKFVSDQWFNTSQTVQYMQTIYCVNEMSEILVPLVREELAERESLAEIPSSYSAAHASELIYHMKLLIVLRKCGEEGYYKLKDSVYGSDIINVCRTFNWGDFNDDAEIIENWYAEFSAVISGVEGWLYKMIPSSYFIEEDAVLDSEFEVENGILIKYNGRGKYVKVPEGVHTIGTGAFKGNPTLKNIELPSYVVQIKKGAFDDCPDLTAVTVIANAIITEEDSFVNYNKNFTIYGHENSAIQAYAENNDINFVIIKNSYNDSMNYTDMDFEIENGVLKRYNGSSEDVYIPYGVVEIGEGAFRDCVFLRNVIFSGSVKKIGTSAFYGCVALGNVDIPANVVEIGNYAFAGCIGLSKVALNYGLQSIGAYAFERCENLEEIIIPDSVIYLGERVFSYCTGMVNAVVGDGIAAIEEFTFHYCSSLENITIGNSVEIIGYSSFNNCTSLTEVILPSGVDVIASYAFANCTSLSKADLNYGLKTIDAYAFECCENLKEINIPDSVTNIGQCAFRDCKDMVLADVGNGLIVIDESTFRGCKSLKSVTLGNSLERIGYSAFHSCESLESIDIPSGVTVIESYAFTDCINLEDVKFGNGLKTIDSYAFFGCNKIKDLVIPDGVVVIGNSAFLACGGLKSVVIGDGVIDIGDFAFKDCTALVSLTLGNSLETIGTSAFRGCEKIVSIEFPNSIKTIGNYAFAECIGLVRVTLGENLTTINSSAFSDCYKLIEVCNNSLLNIEAKSGDFGCVALYANHVYKSEYDQSKVIFVNDYIFYVYNDTEYFLMGYSGDDLAISLPNKIQGKNYYIYPCAFYNNDCILSAVIPDCILGVGAGAFYSCDNLIRLVFCGEEEDWNALPKGEGWNDGIAGNVMFHNYNGGICSECGAVKDTEPVTILGDVSGDGLVTNADVLIIYRYIYNSELYPLDIIVGDVNGDGAVTNADVLVIYRYIYNPVLYPIG